MRCVQEWREAFSTTGFDFSFQIPFCVSMGMYMCVRPLACFSGVRMGIGKKISKTKDCESFLWGGKLKGELSGSLGALIKEYDS